MRILFIIAAAIPVLLTVALAQDGPRRAHESPFACDRLALTSAERKRHFDELGPALRTLVKGVRELPSGYEFQFPATPAAVQQVAEWAAGEYSCCPFFKIELRFEPEHGPFWLRLTGRDGTKDFMKSEFAKWFQNVKP